MVHETFKSCFKICLRARTFVDEKKQDRQEKNKSTESVEEYIFGSAVLEAGRHQLQRPLQFCGSVAAKRLAGNSLEQKRVSEFDSCVHQSFGPRRERTDRPSIATIFPGLLSNSRDT